MKKSGKSVIWIIVLLIATMSYLTVAGVTTTYGDITTKIIKSVDDIRWGIDIRGGVDVTFSPPEGYNATDEEMASAESIIKVRLVSLNITDSEVYTDFDNDRIIVRFPWKANETDFNPEQAIAELGETASLTFREKVERDAQGKPTGETQKNVVIEGKDIVSATATQTQDQKTGQQVFAVSLKLSDDGAKKFAEGTKKVAAFPQGQNVISIWMDETLISAPTVEKEITGGQAIITGNFTAEEAIALANKINAGALPFKLMTQNFNSISPILGLDAKDAMVMAGTIAFALIALFMISIYRVPGAVAAVALFGQIILMITSITGFFGVFPSFTLTLPGIAGIILAIGFGVDANIITAERIKEELRAGKTLDGAINSGFKRAFSAILDGNVTVIIVAIILMGAFGPPNSTFAKLLTPVFFMFGPTTAGSIYSFGYTLLVGVLLNMVMGVLASKLMIKSISRYEAFRNPVLYGGAK